MHRVRFTVLTIPAAALIVACSYTMPSLAVATNQHHLGVHTLVPGQSVGPVALGASEAAVHIGPSKTNGPGSVFYPRYSLTVAYKHGRVVAIATNELAVDPNAMVSPGQYQTHTQPNVAIGVPIRHVSSRYPKAQCAHHVISHVPSLVTENCLLRGTHGHTFFAGGAVKQGQVILINAILITVPTAGPQHP
jgi:hypothetical protein